VADVEAAEAAVAAVSGKIDIKPDS